MKTRLRLLTLFVCTVFVGINVANSMPQWRASRPVNVSEEIRGGVTSRTATCVSVSITEDGYLHIDFEELMGNITIKVSTASGQVKHQQPFSVFSIPQELDIYIDNYPSGNYKIEFIYPSGNTLTGEFSL